MAMRLKSRSSEDDLEIQHEINVTPFIDVILVLLIIFMVAAPLATVDIGVNLPASTAPEQPRPDKPVFVTIKPDETIAVGGDHGCTRGAFGCTRCRHQQPQGRNDFRSRRQVAELWRADGGYEHLAGCRIPQARFGRAGDAGRQAMNAFALHLPERRGFSRWTLAGVTVLMAHAAIVAAVALWYPIGSRDRFGDD
jgi:Biopolymer transport protein ExbD/TolR